jgi:excisionase family DNA binding protein
MNRDSDSEPILQTVRDVAQLLAIGRTGVYQLIGQGDLEVVHIGRAARIPAAAVHDFVRRCREAGGSSAVAELLLRPAERQSAGRVSNLPRDDCAMEDGRAPRLCGKAGPDQV